jgi:sortase A
MNIGWRGITAPRPRGSGTRGVPSPLALVLPALLTPALAASAAAQPRSDPAQARARFERAAAHALQRQPDMRDWSDVRRVAYRNSLRHRLDAPIAVLEVPRFGIEVAVLPKDDDVSLDRAVSYVRGTALPGRRGNVGIAGHRDSYFRKLERARPGDVVRLVWPEGVRTYRVAETRILRPEAVEVLAPTDRDALTLVTCFPFRYVGHAPERFVVRAYAADERPGRGAKTGRLSRRPGTPRANAWQRAAPRSRH